MVILLGTVPLIIRIIGLEEYGLWALVSAVVGLVSLMEGGLSISTTVFASRDLARNDSIGLAQTITVAFVSMIGLATLISVSLAVSSGVIGSLFTNLNVLEKEAVVSALRFSAIVIWARLAQQVFAGIEQAHHRYGILNTISTIQQALMSLGVLWVAWMGGRIVAFMLWHAAISVLSLLVHVVVVWRLIRPVGLSFHWSKAKWREIGFYSLLSWVSTLGTALFGQCDRLIVGRLLGTEILGIYAAITNVTLQINSVSALPTQPLVPFIAGAKANHQLQSLQVRRRVKEALEVSAVIALGLGATLFLLAPMVLKLLLPAAQAAFYRFEFQMAVVIYSLYSINAVGYHLLYGIQAVKTSMWVQLSIGGITLVLISLGAYSGGLKGAIFGAAGYLGVGLLTVLGMRGIQLSVKEWMGWLAPYLMCFGVILGLGGMLPNALLARMGLVLLGTAAIGGCFLLRNKRYLLAVSEKLVLR